MTQRRGLDACGNCDFGHCNVRDLIHDFSFEPGYRVGMGYFTPNWTTELTYFWIREAHAKCSRQDDGKVYFSIKHPDFSNDFEGADHGEAKYETGLQNAELNYYRYVTPRKKDYFAVAWLAGIRYNYLAEGLELAFRSGQDVSHYTIDTHNFMYGVQDRGRAGVEPVEMGFVGPDGERGRGDRLCPAAYPS